MELVDLIVNHDFPKFRALGTLDSQIDNLIDSEHGNYDFLCNFYNMEFIEVDYWIYRCSLTIK